MIPCRRLFFAKHLLTASVMAAPGAVVVAKILFPQTEAIDQKMEVSMDKVGTNFLDAMSNGTTEGLKLAVNVGAMLLVFFAFIAMFNYRLLQDRRSATGLNAWVADISDGNFQGLSLEFILGYLFAPLMWLIGVASEDITLTGRLVGREDHRQRIRRLREPCRPEGRRCLHLPAQHRHGHLHAVRLRQFRKHRHPDRWDRIAWPHRKRAWLSEFGFRALLGGTLASLVECDDRGDVGVKGPR